MSTTENFNVYKGLPYQVRARANGKWDYTASQTFTTEGQAVNVSMTAYDGLSMDYVESYQSADKLDFSNTMLPWKWQYSTALSTNRYCLMPQGQNYENVKSGQYVTDYTVVGSPTISSEYVVSGFSSSNYLQASGKRTYTAGEINSFEIIFHVITGNSLQSNGRLYQPSDVSTGDSTLAPTIVAEPSEGIYLWFHTTSEPVCRAVSSVATNTEYWLKWTYDGTDMKGYYSNDGGLTWTLNATITSFTPYWNYKDFKLGNRNGGVTVFNGSIDLKNSYVKINGDMWWIGAEFTKEAKQVLNSNITNTGGVSIDSNFVASGFARYKYLQFQNIFNPGANPWKIVLKVKMSNVTTQTSLLWQSTTNTNQGRWGIYWYFSEGKLVFIGTSNGSAWDLGISGTHVYDTNKWYWLKLEYSTTEGYKLSYSEDGSVYTLDNSSIATTPLYSNLPYMMVGQYNPSNNDLPILGSMDLSETYFEVNGNVVLSGTNHVTETLAGCTYNFTDDGSATTLNCFAVNGDESVVLTPDNSYTNGWKLGMVNIPSHTVYNYDNGVWTEIE